MPKAARSDSEFMERYWSRVTRTRDGCWEWIGARSAAGYGQIKRDGIVYYAHRIAWRAAHDEVPEGQLVLHTCDNRGCVNPDHLFLGDKGANNRDCAQKFRGNGRKHSPVARLLDHQVIEIRQRYAARDVSQEELARRFGVAQMTISKIVRGETWKRLLT